jgi:hypothetical protein
MKAVQQMPKIQGIIARVFDKLPLPLLRSIGLDYIELNRMRHQGHLDISVMSLHAHLIRTHLIARCVSSLLLVGKKTDHLADHLARVERGPFHHLDSLGFVSSPFFDHLSKNLRLSLGMGHDKYFFLDALCILDPECSSYVLRRPHTLAEIGLIVRRAFFLQVHVEPSSLAAEEAGQGGFRTKNTNALYEQEFVRTQLHNAGFFDVVDVLTVEALTPRLHFGSISRLEKPFVYLTRNKLTLNPTSEVKQYYLASKTPLTDKILL